MSDKFFKSGFVTIVGRPNVGKSTLLNNLVGQKIAIISDKPQTTRNSIQGILTRDEYQIIFIDTPGIHRPRHLLGEYMVKTAYNALQEVDVVLFLIDGAAGIGKGDKYIMEYLKGIQSTKFLLINKIDAFGKDKMNQIIATLNESGVSFDEVLPVSALTGENLDILLDRIALKLPKGPLYYPEDEITDHPERFIIAEIIREKALYLLEEEVPHAVAVDVEEIAPRDETDLLYVKATIYIERDSQRGILIGKGGRMIKKIGSLAREELEGLMGSAIYLDLDVKVQKGWRKRSELLRSLGYEDQGL